MRHTAEHCSYTHYMDCVSPVVLSVFSEVCELASLFFVALPLASSQVTDTCHGKAQCSCVDPYV